MKRLALALACATTVIACSENVPSSASATTGNIETAPAKAEQTETTRSPEMEEYARQTYRVLSQFKADITLWHQQEPAERIKYIQRLQKLATDISAKWADSRYCLSAAQQAFMLASSINVMDTKAISGSGIDLLEIHQITSSAANFGGQLEACAMLEVL